MNQIQVFKTSNKSVLATKDKINDWAYTNNYKIEQIEVISENLIKGEYEIIIFVLFSEKENN